MRRVSPHGACELALTDDILKKHAAIPSEELGTGAVPGKKGAAEMVEQKGGGARETGETPGKK